MLHSLLDTAATDNGMNYAMLAIIAVLVVVIVVFYFISSKKRKKQEQDAKDLIDAVGPGNKVKTIGGICGIVVEVDNEENTFVLETGSENSGKSYIKFDKQAIFQTDAVVEHKEDKAESDEVTENSEAPVIPEATESAPVETEEVPVEAPVSTEGQVSLSENGEAAGGEQPEMLKKKKNGKTKEDK